MKKTILMLAVVAAGFAACNSPEEKAENAAADTVQNQAEAKADNIAAKLPIQLLKK